MAKFGGCVYVTCFVYALVSLKEGLGRA